MEFGVFCKRMFGPHQSPEESFISDVAAILDDNKRTEARATHAVRISCFEGTIKSETQAGGQN